MKHKLLIAACCLLLSSSLFAEDTMVHTMNHDHAAMHPDVTLTEAGNDVFGTIQEVIRALSANPDTDWSQVDLEALRQHLLDMRDMTLNVDILSTDAISNGAVWVIRGTTERSQQALKRVLSAHPEQLNNDTGWVMSVTPKQDTFVIKVTGSKADTDKIRGLGYIGIMAYGEHHQPHHWAMANGMNPHSMH